MLTPLKEPKMTKETKPKLPTDVTVTPEQHAEAVQSFMYGCLRVKYNKSGLPKSKQASAEAVTAVAENAGGADEDSFSVAKRLFKAGKDSHPLIQKINAWASQVDKWRNSFTFSMAADSTLDAGTLAKARGERLVRVDDTEAFENGLLDMEEDGLKLSRKLYEDWDQLMALEKTRLKKEFKEADYPAKDAVWQETEEEVEEDGVKKTVKKENCILRIGRRSYSEVTASVRLPEKVLERMTVQTAELMNQSVEVAIADIVSMMVETFTTLANQLVDRIRIRPPYQHELYKKIGAEAEVLRVFRHEQDDEIPEGCVTIEVQYSERGRPGETKKKKVTETFGPMPEDDYEALRPEPMEATKRLTTSVVERFGEQLETFSNLQAKMGAYGGHMDQALDVLRDLHHRALKGRTKAGAEGVIDAVKHSSAFRVELREALEGVCGTLQNVAEEVKVVRRKVHGSIAQQIAKASAKRGS